MRLLPEPIEMPTSIPRDMASEMLKLPADDRITLSCPGEINTRKGCARLLEAFRLSNTSNKIRLVLFGPHSPELDLLIRTRYSDLVRDGHLLAENRILSNNEFNALFDTTDAIALLYQRHMGSSSILLKAAARGKELLTSQSGFLGWATETLGLGVTCDEDSVEAIASALCRLATDSKHDSHGKETNFQTIREFYTLKNHIAHWTSGIRELFSLSSSEGDKYEFPRALLPSLQSYISSN
jgi:glycosyltransferase involved in cell wall biosynthesis